jgi:hypothetical protein
MPAMPCSAGPNPALLCLIMHRHACLALPGSIERDASAVLDGSFAKKQAADMATIESEMQHVFR